jgi:hypothetical protein
MTPLFGWNTTVMHLEMAPWNPHQIEVGVRTVTLKFFEGVIAETLQ